MSIPKPDLTRLTLAILFIAGMIAASFWILAPFLPATIWAATLVVATWPIMRRVQARLWNSRALAVTVMTIAILLVFVMPFWLAIDTIVKNSEQIAHWGEFVTTMQMPPPPAWLGDVPLVGRRAVEIWLKIGDASSQELLQRIRPYAVTATQWFVGAVGSFGMVLLQFLLTLAVSAIMFTKGEGAADMVVRFARRLAGERGVESARLAAQAIRGVALGVVVTALVQTAIGGLGLVITGVPFAPILCALMFMFCIAQIGPGLVVIPAVIWMYVSNDAGWATVLAVFGILAISLDNVLRPLLIKKGAHLPLLLVLVGVIGGLIAFGLIGIFIGPTVLAVAYTLLQAWVAEGDAMEARPTVTSDPPPP
ncbi:MAG TPA: AI-2E family transporter YdiK [Hypericibacter adhaerens]|uniref:AI-2E family transporter YdiK n=1 Tax=Hypericibacter adhaerens TaxID=2602016 RepID=UPI002C369AA4|nr:AI-2E family transporter YdiK [Hypericibacter adhaerens]HWA42676.1 AI-2E family transporter YdiK [Hypericibacter adhaerens]